MEQMALIARVRGNDDRRYVSTHITAKGLAIVDRLDKEICAIHRQHLGHLSRAQLEQLVSLLTLARHGPG
jgi:DNA-binding MarR family transcriptional regulator